MRSRHASSEIHGRFCRAAPLDAPAVHRYRYRAACLDRQQQVHQRRLRTSTFQGLLYEVLASCVRLGQLVITPALTWFRVYPVVFRAAVSAIRRSPTPSLCDCCSRLCSQLRAQNIAAPAGCCTRCGGAWKAHQLDVAAANGNIVLSRGAAAAAGAPHTLHGLEAGSSSPAAHHPHCVTRCSSRCG